METMKVRITGADQPKWYANRIGEMFTVKTAEWRGTGLHEVVPYNYGNAIHKDHFEIVTEDEKIVEHEGIKYKVPSWAKFLTRDNADDKVFCFEFKPRWSGEEWVNGTYGEGRVDEAEVYEEPKPEGNFIKEI